MFGFGKKKPSERVLQFVICTKHRVTFRPPDSCYLCEEKNRMRIRRKIQKAFKGKTLGLGLPASANINGEEFAILRQAIEIVEREKALAEKEDR